MAQQAPLMPKATAVWLVENTTLTFDQIADFCGLHQLEVKAIADGEVAIGMIGNNPIVSGQLTDEEVKRCEGDPRAKLKMLRNDLPQPVTRSKGPRYTPVTKRADKPDGILFLLKTHPELQEVQVARLLGTTKDTVVKVRDRTHWNSQNIKPRDPVLLGLCKRTDLDAALKKAQRRITRLEKEAAKAARLSGQPIPLPVAGDQPAYDPGAGDQPEVNIDLPSAPHAPAADQPAIPSMEEQPVFDQPDYPAEASEDEQPKEAQN